MTEKITKKQLKALIDFIPKGDVRPVLQNLRVVNYLLATYLVAVNGFAIAMIKINDGYFKENGKVISRNDLLKFHAVAGKYVHIESLMESLQPLEDDYPSIEGLVPNDEEKPVAQESISVDPKILASLDNIAGYILSYKFYEGFKMVSVDQSNIYILMQRKV